MQPIINGLMKRKQLEEIAKLKEEKEAQAKIDAEINKRQAEEDNLLLSIFNNEEEIAKSYDSRLELADVTIKLLKDRHKAQSERLEELEQRHEKMVNIKHKQKMQKQIDSVLDNLKIYQQAITENVIEKDKVSNDYVETLTRFRDLLARSEAKE